MALYCVVTPAGKSREFAVHLIFFETALVSLDVNGRVLIALFDGSLLDTATKSSCVALCHCERETAEALRQSLRSILKAQQ